MKELRPLVIPEDGHGIAEIDYAGAEICVAVSKYRDLIAKRLCDTGKPVAAMAQILFREELGAVPVLEIKNRYPHRYEAAKVASYGSLYGMMLPCLSTTLGITQNEARLIQLRLVTDVWPDVEKGLTAELRTTTNNGRKIIITPGLHRHLPGINASNDYKLRTTSRNTGIQGLCAAVFRRACIYANKGLKAYRGRILLPIYDSLLISAPLDCLAEAATAVKAAMERAALDELGDFVRMTADVETRNPSAWSKKGRIDSFDLFMADPSVRL